MALQQIRGEQIRNQAIKDSHINGKLTEAVLDIKFQDHASEIFQKKLVADYIQKNNVAQATTGNTVNVTLPSPAAANDDAKGVILNKYPVKLRETGTGLPVIFNNKEVYGKLVSFADLAGVYTYKMDFFITQDDGSEVSATVDGGKTLDIVYPQRFTLDDVNEMFAANEKFVDATTDVTSYLDGKQLGKDIFGTGYNFNNLGDFSDPFGNGKSVVEQLEDETSGAISGEKAKNIIDEVVEGRGGNTSINERFAIIENTIGSTGSIDARFDVIEAEITAATDDKGYANLNARFTEIENDLSTEISTIKNDLAGETAGKGASLIHVELGSDVAAGVGLTSAGSANLQDVLDAFYNKFVTDLGAEVTNRTTADTNFKNKLASTIDGQGASMVGVEDDQNYFTGTDVEAVLKELFEKINSDVSAEATARTNADNVLQGYIDALEAEVEAARGSRASVDARLDVSLNEDGSLKDYDKFHKHISKDKTLAVDTTTVDFVFSGVDQFNTPKISDTYVVLVNGMRQVKTKHYNISVVDNTVTVTFTSTVYATDIVEIEAVIYANPQTI